MRTHRSGFTLVELSIVLIIIGLIIGGVMKGTDMINSAKTKKVYTTWIKGWQVAANQYQDRTGQLLDDGAVNGGAGAANGTFDNTNLVTTTSVQNRLRQIGIEVPTSNTGTTGAQYRLEGKDATGLSQLSLTNVNFSGRNRNVISFTNVPNDIALALDTMIDGIADAGLGDCRLSTQAAAGTTLVWPDSNAALSTVYIAF
ncbi:MAG: prepilin-type N-terminal cleavage/methylation domain-containing protein [Sulfuricurvum sp.]|nr:prepilin-type N-terminal cleavage/methylation domain-containing protein [Sulfuricurvum sp.]